VTQPPEVPADDRDWTYVISDGCADCGFTPQRPEDTGDRLRASIPQWTAALSVAEALQRPEPTVWSTLDQDATAIEGRYFEQRPDVVAGEVADELSATAAAFDAVGPGQWQRSGRRSNGSVFTVSTLAVYFLHDIEHHIWDVTIAQAGQG
jgi:hypothetical protein